MRFNPVIKAYCERLQKTKGRAYKEVRCAAARKLLHLGYAVVKSGQPFDPAYQPPSKKKAVSPKPELARAS